MSHARCHKAPRRMRGGDFHLPYARHGWLAAVCYFLAVAACAGGFVPGARAQRPSAVGLTATLDSRTGAYQVTSRAPAWEFRGSVGSRVERVARATGRDGIGPFHALRFAWRWHSLPVTAEIITYDLEPIARFELRCDRATPHSPIPFPDFTSLPAGLHVFSYRNQAFSPPQFSAGEYGTPWLLFDDRADAAILSPAAGFQVTTLRGDGTRRVAVRLDDAITHVPAGYSVRSLLVVTRGIGRAFRTWGKALTRFEGVTRPSNESDPTLRTLGYWTDNGATYYYNFDPKLGYAGTLRAEIAELRSRAIPIGYLQLDSWWYQKDRLSFTGRPLTAKNPRFPLARWNVYGGIWLYEASPTLFPQGLAAFHRGVGLPFVVHSRWMGQDSPYRRQYRIAGVAPIDPSYWRHIARYLRASGVATYEQDWASVIRDYSGFHADPRIGDEFFDEMAAAMRQASLTMQYCMPEPSELLQGSRYSNLTTTRVSDDKFVRARWYNFLFTSQFAAALGIWPWADVATSTDANLILLQTLSAGPVGFGDAIGQENRENLMQAARKDGVLIKPDAPLVPLDRDYLDAALGRHEPTLGRTYTRQNGVTTAYVFAFARTPLDRGPVRFRAAQVGLRGRMAVYDYFSRQLTVVPSGESFRGQLEKDDASYYVCAAMGKSGIAFLGDAGKFVGTGRVRIAAIRDSPTQLEATVVFAKGERAVTLHGYAGSPPEVTVKGGTADTLRYDRSNREFTVTISPRPRASLATQAVGQPPVREATVYFRSSRAARAEHTGSSSPAPSAR